MQRRARLQRQKTIRAVPRESEISMRTICIVTATRAEYGLLRPVVQKISKSDMLALQLVVTGAHLCPRLGETVHEIENDGFPIAARLPIFTEDAGEPVAKTIARTLTVFDDYFAAHRPMWCCCWATGLKFSPWRQRPPRGIFRSPISRAGMLRWARPMNTTATASPRWRRCIFRPAPTALRGLSAWARPPARCSA